MKRLFTLLISSFIVLAANAQVRLEGFRTMLADSRVSASYSYDVDGTVPVGGKGTVIVQGNCWTSKGNGMRIYCDGTSIWTVDEEAKEVYIEQAMDDSVQSVVGRFIDKATEIRSSKGVITGSFTDETSGGKVRFRIADVKSTPTSSDLSAFRLRTETLGKDWVVTDLR